MTPRVKLRGIRTIFFNRYLPVAQATAASDSIDSCIWKVRFFAGSTRCCCTVVLRSFARGEFCVIEKPDPVDLWSLGWGDVRETRSPSLGSPGLVFPPKNQLQNIEAT
jgi:hypothetical protein